MARIKYILLLFILTSFAAACASTKNANRSNNIFHEDIVILVEKSKEAILENNLRIHSEETLSDGAHQITAYRPERRHYTSEEQAINRIRVILTPVEGDGFRVTVQEPSTHAMARSATTREYRGAILRMLNELLPQSDREDFEETTE